MIDQHVRLVSGLVEPPFRDEKDPSFRGWIVEAIGVNGRFEFRDSCPIGQRGREVHRPDQLSRALQRHYWMLLAHGLSYAAARALRDQAEARPAHIVFACSILAVAVLSPLDEGLPVSFFDRAAHGVTAHLSSVQIDHDNAVKHVESLCPVGHSVTGRSVTLNHIEQDLHVLPVSNSGDRS